MRKKFSYTHNFSTKTECQQPHQLTLFDPPDSAQMLADWGFLLTEVISYSPWSREASAFVDRAIVLREGGVA